MNGRIERADARLEFNSEDNYSSIDFFFEEARRARLKARLKDGLRMLLLFGLIAVIFVGVNRAL